MTVLSSPEMLTASTLPTCTSLPSAVTVRPALSAGDEVLAVEARDVDGVGIFDGHLTAGGPGGEADTVTGDGENASAVQREVAIVASDHLFRAEVCADAKLPAPRDGGHRVGDVVAVGSAVRVRAAIGVDGGDRGHPQALR